MKKTNKYVVIVSRRAAHSLLSHVEFLSRVNISAAKKLHSQYQQAIRILAQTPLRFPYLDEDNTPSQQYRKCIFYKRYIIVYLIVGNTIYIDAVRDDCQNPAS